MADLKMSAATALDAAGAVSRGAGLGGASRKTVDNLRATADPTATDDSSAGYHIGSTWWRADTGEMWSCSDATATAAVWRPRWGQYASPRNRFYTFTDCVGFPGFTGSSDGPWLVSYSGTGAAIGLLSIGTLNALGVATLDLGTTTTGRSAIWSGPVSVKLGSGRARYQAKAAIHTLSSGTETYTTRIGLMDSVSGESTDGIFFRYTDGVNAGKWQIVCRSNGVETASDSGVTPVADTWQRFEIDVNAAGTSVAFKVDGVATTNSPITTNIPTGSTRETSFGIMSLKSAGTTATAGAYVDFMEFEYLFTTAR